MFLFEYFINFIYIYGGNNNHKAIEYKNNSQYDTNGKGGY